MEKNRPSVSSRFIKCYSKLLITFLNILLWELNDDNQILSACICKCILILSLKYTKSIKKRR